jgi:hypothetical protein
VIFGTFLGLFCLLNGYSPVLNNIKLLKLAVKIQSNLHEKDLIENVGEILEWILNWNLKLPINELPSEQICDILIIVYLFQNECISGFEAVWIFQNTLKMATEEIPKKNPYYQKTVSGRALRVCQLFLEFKTFFVACLSSVGLEYLAVSFFIDFKKK